ncbi:MAG: ATP synthase F0 subunit C [Myxococcota bacterium]
MKRWTNGIAVLALYTLSTSAFAAGESNVHNGWYAVAAALAIGLPAFAGALAQGRTAAAALEGIARNPNASNKVFVPMILGMALIESLVLFGLITAFMLSSNIH